MPQGAPMLNEKEILLKIKSRDIFDGRKHRSDLLNDLPAVQRSWAERNTQECDPSLWRKRHILGLPTDDLQRFLQLTVPMEGPYSYTDAALWLTSTEGLQQIRQLAAKHGLEILEKSPCNSPRRIIDCAHKHQSPEIYLHYSFTGNDMGDGNAPIHIKIAVLDQNLWAIPFTIIEKKRVKKTKDSLEKHLDNQWTQIDEIVEKTTYTSRVHYFCESHCSPTGEHAKAQMQVAKYYRDLYPKAKNQLYTAKILKYPYHRDSESIGQTTEECLFHKIKVVPRDHPVLVYNPEWIL